MLRPEMTPIDRIPSAGTPSKPKPKPTTETYETTVPLVVFTAFDADTAEALSQRLQNTARPANTTPPTAPHLPPPLIHEPRLPNLTEDTEEPEITVADSEIPWSSELPFLSLDAGEMSYYFSAQEDELVRGVAISLQREKFILHYLEDPLEYLKHFATYTWDEDSDAAAEEFIQWYVERFKSELERQREYDWSRGVQNDIEYWIRNVANDERESVIVYDLEAGEILFVRYGDKDSVTMQEWHQKLAEGRNIVVIHNHPNNSGASPADFSAAAWLDAEYMIVVNPDGTQHHHQRIGDRMVALEPIHNPDNVAPADPLETAVSSIAYWIQTLREFGNPPEAVFEQGEPLWWQEGNLIVVPYYTTETREQVAARMGIPVEHLEKLNEENVEIDMMHIPLPGWYAQTIDEPSGSWVSVAHTTGATFFDSKSLLEKDQLISQWNSLRPVEQQIEMALMGSDANIDKFVRFDNAGYGFDDTLSWIHDREIAISQAAMDFQVPAALLKTVIVSELLYDYRNDDQLQDDIIRANFNLLARQLLGRNDKIRDSWDGAGVANAHYPALIDAYFYVKERLEPGEIHPWDLAPDAPDLASATELYATETEKTDYVERYAEFYENRSFNELKPREQEVALYWIRAGKLNDVPRDLRVEIAHYLADDSGSVRATAMISHMYSEQLREFDGEANIAENPRDIARVWGRYRSADENFDYLGNARLAFPIAEYWGNQ